MIPLVLYLSLMMGAPAQAEPAPLYTQTYSIFIHGSLAGTEAVTERRDKDGNRVCSSRHDMLVTDGLETKRMAFETTMVFVKDTVIPTKYSYRFVSGDAKDSYDVTVKNGKITRVLSRGGTKSETTADLRPDTVILDFNVYHQYDVLARLYDFKKKGRQTFSDFIPVIGNQVSLAVTWLEDSKLDYGRGSVEVRNFKIEFVGVRTGNFSTDMDGRLVRLLMREQDLEVLRQDLVPEK